MIFREIASADIPSLFHVRTRTRENRLSLEELENLGITEKSVAEKMSLSSKGWLCQIADSVVGFCMADRSAGELLVIAVLPDFEGRGIGGKLMSLAEDWLWRSGCQRAWLTTDVDTRLKAYGFYRHRGWGDWKLEGGLRYMQLFPPQTT